MDHDNTFDHRNESGRLYPKQRRSNLLFSDANVNVMNETAEVIHQASFMQDSVMAHDTNNICELRSRDRGAQLFTHHGPNATQHTMSGIIKQEVYNHKSLEKAAQQQDQQLTRNLLSMEDPQNAMGNHGHHRQLNFGREISDIQFQNQTPLCMVDNEEVLLQDIDRKDEDLLALKYSNIQPDMVVRPDNDHMVQGQDLIYQQMQQQALPQDLGLKDYDYEEASMILHQQFDPTASLGRLSIEDEEIIKSHVNCPGLKYAKIDTIKFWMTNQTRKVMADLGMSEQLEGKWRIAMKNNKLRLHIDPPQNPNQSAAYNSSQVMHHRQQ